MFKYLNICFNQGEPTGGAPASNEPGTANVATPAGAKDEFRQLAAELRETVKSHTTESAEAKASLERINERMDALEFGLKKANRAQKPEGKQGYEHADTFRTALKRWTEGDRRNLHKDIEAKSGYHPDVEQKTDNMVRFDIESAGALLLPSEFSRDLIHNVQESSPIMQLVTVTQTDRQSVTRTLRTETPGVSWIEEAGTVSKGKTKYKNIEITPHKAAAKYGFSIEQFEDSGWDLTGEINTAWTEDFDIEVAKQIINGDGIKKPTGMLEEAKVADLGDRTLDPDELIDMQEELLEVYQRNAAWLFNRKTRAYVRKEVLSNDAIQYLWEPDFTRGSPTLLLGAPVYIAADDHMHGVTTGNFDANSKPILFGDFRRAYQVVLRTDMYVIDDIYSDSDAFVRNINIMARIGGHPLEADKCLVALKKTA